MKWRTIDGRVWTVDCGVWTDGWLDARLRFGFRLGNRRIWPRSARRPSSSYSHTHRPAQSAQRRPRDQDWVGFLIQFGFGFDTRFEHSESQTIRQTDSVESLSQSHTHSHIITTHHTTQNPTRLRVSDKTDDSRPTESGHSGSTLN